MAMAMTMTASWTAGDLESWRASMQAVHDSGVNLSLEWRQTQIKAMRTMIEENREQFVNALRRDLGKSRVESLVVELEQILGEIRYLERNLASSLMQPQKVASPALLTPSRSWIEYKPLLGPAVLVIGPFNYPVSLLLQPAIGALAAGNPCILKPSEHCPAVQQVLSQLVPLYFEPNACRVVLGGVEQAKLLLQQSWGKVVFTGSKRVGKLVAQETAKTLTPTLLELGGKCPCYVEGGGTHNVANMDWNKVAWRIVWAKLLNAGQTCAAVDYIVVTQDAVDKLVPALIQAVRVQFGQNPMESQLGRIVTAKPHAQRLMELIQDVETIASQHAKIKINNNNNNKPCQVVLGSSAECRPEEKYICPTLVLNPPLDSRIMEEEVFGPILSILTVANRTEAIQLMQHVEKQVGTPLCLYVFSKSNKVFREVTCSCRSGSAVHNDAVVQLGSILLPFGGIGQSGIGTYHGPHSFRQFSQPLACLHRPLWPGSDFGNLRCHPYGPLKQFVLEKVGTQLPYIPVIPDSLKWIVGLVALTVALKAAAPASIASLMQPVWNRTAQGLEQWAQYLRGDDDS